MPALIAHQSKRRPAQSQHAHARPAATRGMVRAGVSLAPFVQAKLRVGTPNDRFEQEADRVAERVMRMPDTASAPAHPAGFAGDAVQRKCAACASGHGLCTECAEEERLQTKRCRGREQRCLGTRSGSGRQFSECHAIHRRRRDATVAPAIFRRIDRADEFGSSRRGADVSRCRSTFGSAAQAGHGEALRP